MPESKIVSTLEQGRAAAAYGYVKDAVGQLGDKRKKEYKSYVKKLPVMIKTNGLGQTLAFIKAKGSDAYSKIYEQLKDWLSRCPNPIIGGGSDLVEAVINLDSGEYRAATSETLSLLKWMRRFADGMIEGESNE